MSIQDDKSISKYFLKGPEMQRGLHERLRSEQNQSRK